VKRLGFLPASASFQAQTAPSLCVPKYNHQPRYAAVPCTPGDRKGRAGVRKRAANAKDVGITVRVRKP